MAAAIDDAVQLIRMEYTEFPGLVLTFWQVQRLCRLTDDECTSALSALTRCGYLQRTEGGQYVRPLAERPSGRYAEWLSRVGGVAAASIRPWID